MYIAHRNKLMRFSLTMTDCSSAVANHVQLVYIVVCYSVASVHTCVCKCTTESKRQQSRSYGAPAEETDSVVESCCWFAAKSLAAACYM